MTQPVRYVIRAPLFISSRLMPAITVAGLTIHLQAAGIDRDEPDDPRVRWEYLIEGRSLLHAGRDLSTPYHGPAAIGAQLPAAMATLLAHLSHLADADGVADASMPGEIVAWARRHRDDIATITDRLDSAAQRMSASARWRAITHDPDQTPYGRWCVGQATQHADRMATLSPQPDTADGLVVRDELWHQHALTFYTTIHTIPAPEPAASPACVVASGARIRAWLDGLAPNPSAASMADFLWVRDAGRERIPDLIGAAQHAGLFGVREHTIRAHLVLDNTGDAIAHLLTITTPDGIQLATTPIAGPQLDRHGDDAPAVADLLHRYAAHINNALTTHAPGAVGPAEQGRPFPRLATSQSAHPGHATVPEPPTTGPRHTR